MRRVAFVLGLICVIGLIGTVGFHLVTGEPLIECLYMAAITLSTVGYREPTGGLDDTGKLFVVVYLITGLGVFTYCAMQLGQWVITAELGPLLEKRRMQQAIGQLKDHFIICGCGRMGIAICRELAARSRPFVVIDTDPSRLADAGQIDGILSIEGDATDDDILREAGIDRARALASVLSSDAENLYVVLSAHILNSGIQIVARAGEESAIEKFRRGGARHVISPYHAGAIRIARLLVNPELDNLFEIADGSHEDLEIAEVPLPDGSPLVGRSIAESDLARQEVLVIAIRHADGTRRMPVSGADTIAAGDSLLVIGQELAIQRLLEPTSAD